MNETYYVITQTEDGEISLDDLTSEQLKGRLNENYYGDVVFTTKLPAGYLNDDLGNKMIIIKGNTITPKPVQKVVSYEIP